MLPIEFQIRMEAMLGAEAAAFFASYQQPIVRGLRINTLKLTVDEFRSISPFTLESIPWTKDGFYYDASVRPGKHPYYHAGLYYIQEPSAMAPAAVLDAKPGDKVLDLCAAPGGKSTQIAASLQGKGLLVANDSNAQRTKALVRNLEAWGATNILVTNETPERLAEKFTGYFDKILIDAPCSGEGMFRKDEEAVRSWKTYNVQSCGFEQRKILDQAAKMLRPAGEIVYSTCTFAPDEDEGTINDFLVNHPEFEVIEIPASYGFKPGNPAWVDGRPELARTARLWPHLIRGEGHFVAKLRKMAGNMAVSNGSYQPEQVKNSRLLAYYNAFTAETLLDAPSGQFVLYGDHLYLVDPQLPDLRGIKVVRAGWHLGENKKNRFEPSQALAMGIRQSNVRNVVNFTATDSAVIPYLKGETVIREGSKGWTLICVDGFPLGWGKQIDGILKNFYPKGWRWMD